MGESTNYISMFRIDGKPILPPLMTFEKRLEMQMYREKAKELEGKILRKRVQFDGLSAPRSSSSSLKSQTDIHFDNVSVISRLSGSESDCSPSLKILVNTASNTETQPSREIGTNTSKIVGELTLAERASLLEKSGPIGFDLVANTVITSLTNAEKAAAEAEEVESEIKYNGNAEALRQLVEKLKLERTQSKKSLNLPLAIPAISVDPPTPMTEKHKIIPEVLSGTESVDSFDVSGFQSSSQATQNQVTELAEDSTDESCCTQSTEHFSLALTPQKKITNITAKILKYEKQMAAADDEQQFATSRQQPRRSATDPSLKSFVCEKQNDSFLDSTPRTDDTTTSTTTSLVRSSSFTLDVPSKALIEHLQQKYAADVQMSKSATNYMPNDAVAVCSKNNNRQPNIVPSAWRDTVESKAKRVQKKLNFKPSSRPNSNSRSKTKSNFNVYPNSTAHLWSSPLPPVNPKKSPYDSKGPTTNRATSSTSNSKHKHQTAALGKAHHKPKKCTTYAVHHPTQQQQQQPQPDLQPAHRTQHHTAQNDDIQKLNELIAQQRAEERRLQQKFDEQRRLLLAQLNNVKFQEQPNSILQIEGFSVNASNASLPTVAANSPTSKCNGNYYMTTTFGAAERGSPTSSITNTSSYVPTAGKLPPTSPGVSTAATLVNATAGDNLQSPRGERAQRTAKTYRLTGEKLSQHNCGISTQIVTNYNNNVSERDKRATTPATIELRNAAATVINAYARGFLVRRLFQTEQIQRIVQTIKDTLIFVLNLHMETMTDPAEANTEANIKLKARLLQQLASASRTLHLIFFQTSIKERMEIITRDRKRIKTKLLSQSLKRSPRIA